MARKGILVSNEDVKMMSTVQWMFEYHALRKKEDDDREFNFRMLKHLLVNVLGLNALRPENENKMPKTQAEMTEAEREAYLPLIAWCARPEMLKPVIEQMQSEAAISEADQNKQYEELVAAIDAADGDMEPVLGPIHPMTGKITNRQYPSDNKASESVVDDKQDAQVEDV